MPIRFETSYDASQPELAPPYQSAWPAWVLQARRRRWSTLPLLEVCALLFCLTAIVGMSRIDASAPLNNQLLQYAPHETTR